MPRDIERGLEKHFIEPQVLTYQSEFQKREASDLIKCVKIVRKGRERNREKVSKTDKKSVNLDGDKHRLPYGYREHRQDFKKAALTELKREKDRICCVLWILIVIGSKTKKSLGWFCNLDGGRSRSFYETS